MNASRSHRPQGRPRGQLDVALIGSPRGLSSHGLKKNFVVEQALLYFMEARRALPDEAVVPTRLVLEDKAFDRIAGLVTSPPAPTRALQAGSRLRHREGSAATREGLLQGEWQPMLLAIDTIAAALEG